MQSSPLLHSTKGTNTCVHVCVNTLAYDAAIMGLPSLYTIARASIPVMVLPLYQYSPHGNRLLSYEIQVLALDSLS